MANCRFVSTTEPRVIPGRHLTPCACDDRELGCLPCAETHCCVCQKAHAKAACTECLDAARSDLEAIGTLCASLPEEAVEKGVQSEAMMLLGPVADPSKWNRVTTAAIFERVHLEVWGEPAPLDLAAYLSDCRDELHPAWILGTWEQVWRDHLDHQTEVKVTIDGSVAYLNTQIGYMAEQVEPPFDEFARELRGCRAHLENVLRDGTREEKGAPCVQCGAHMVRTGEDWQCRTCHRTVTEDQYRYAVGVAYRAHALHLTAADLADRIGVKASVIRVWGSRGLVRKRGRNHDGVTLYDVEDAQARLQLGGEAG